VYHPTSFPSDIQDLSLQENSRLVFQDNNLSSTEVLNGQVDSDAPEGIISHRFLFLIFKISAVAKRKIKEF
jgi:hypothetical protein